MILNWLLALVSGSLLGFLVSFLILPWSRGSLILTDQALYYKGWFASRRIPLMDVSLYRARKRRLSILVPPDTGHLFGVGSVQARWLVRIMQELATRNRSSTPQTAEERLDPT